MIVDNNLDEMIDQTVARAHNLSLQKQDSLRIAKSGTVRQISITVPDFAIRSEMPRHSLIV